MTDSIESFEWEQRAKRQKIYMAAAFVVLLAVIGYGLIDRYRLNAEIAVVEGQKIAAERGAQAALQTAEKVAREKVEVEKQLAEKESKRDGKVTEVEAAKVKVLDDRLELNRALRSKRGDNPSAGQVCAELDALGIPCG